MSVNEKMTAIAQRIRNYTGKTEKLSLDKMEASIDEVYEKGKREGYYDGAFDFGNKQTVEGAGSVTVQNVHNITHRINVTVFDEDLTDIMVTRKGKNLLDASVILKANDWEYKDGYYFGKAAALRNCFHPSYSNNSLFNEFKAGTRYTFTLKGYNATDDIASTVGFFFQYSDGTTTVQYLKSNKEVKSVTLVSKEGKDVVGLYATYSANQPIIYLTNLQIEEGNTATDYSEYFEETYNVNFNGKIEEILSVAPTMYFTANKDTAVISVEYLTEN